MATYNEVFKRVEKKYRITVAQRQRLECVMARYMQHDKYGVVPVTSVYLDTPQFALINRSLEKPLYKEKLRFRAYGAQEGAALCVALIQQAQGACGDCSACAHQVASQNLTFFELKKKFKGVVYKRRVPMTTEQVCKFLNAEGGAQGAVEYAAETPLDQQIFRELQAAFLRHAPLAPRMVISCNRLAWVPLAQEAQDLGELRITFDGQLTYREFPHGAQMPIIESRECIMEIKCVGPYPLWLADALAQVDAKPQAFSKYGTAYQLVNKMAEPVVVAPALYSMNPQREGIFCA